MRILTRASLTEEKWVDSISFHFFTDLRRYSIVKQFFNQNTQTSAKTKKHDIGVQEIFFRAPLVEAYD